MVALFTHLYRPHYDKSELLCTSALHHPSASVVTKNEALVHFEGATKHMAGQDAILTKRFNEHEMLVCCCDGHGANGHFHSCIVSSLLSKSLYTCVPLFKRHLEHGNVDKLKELITHCYTQTQALLYAGSFDAIDEFSGTTAAVALVLMVTIDGVPTRQLISTNAGDSSILWKGAEDDAATECSLEHNCDCVEAVEAYLKRMAAKRDAIRDRLATTPASEARAQLEQDVVACRPKPIYYFRADHSITAWLGTQGHYRPFVLFNYTADDTPELNQADYEIISGYGYPHGAQSIRVPETYARATDGRVVVVPGREHENWGATLAGDTQTLNGLGDRGHYPHFSSDPFVSVRTLHGKGNLLVASDGWLDLFHFDELMGFIQAQSGEPDFEARMYAHLFEAAAKHAYASGELCAKQSSELAEHELRVTETALPETRSEKDKSDRLLLLETTVQTMDEHANTRRYPKWDDVSAVVVSFE